MNPKLIEEQIIETLKTVYDPEIPVDIYELGLIYDSAVSETGSVVIEMTLTSPNCPVADSLPNEVRDRVLALPLVREVDIKLVFDPPWSPDLMSELAKFAVGW